MLRVSIKRIPGEEAGWTQLLVRVGVTERPVEVASKPYEIRVAA